MPSFRRRLVPMLAALLFAASTAAQTPFDARDLADNAAAVIEREYFDPARAHEIADALRRQAQAGAFDAQDASAATQRMSAFLRGFDRHLRVQPAREMAQGEMRPPRDAGPGPVARPRSRPRGPGGDGITRVERLSGDVGLLALDGFADFNPGDPDAPERRVMDVALQKLEGVRALVIDLRGNRGGSPAMVGYLASAFLSADAHAYNTFHSRARGESNEAPSVPYPTPYTTLPLFVLVDRGTASAAEAFAYTLQQAGRAAIVGETSAGAANPGRPFPLDGGYEVFVATGSPVNPNSGRNWEGTGVVPDIAVVSVEALDAALARIRADVPRR